jgi:Flp pilus assembly protein TadG
MTVSAMSGLLAITLPRVVRRFARDRRGATAVEYALLLPFVMLMSFAIVEVSLCMASLVTLEGGLKEASRYGITSQDPGTLTPAMLAQVPTTFSGADTRTKQIMAILNMNTLDLIDLNTATVTTQVFSSFSVVKDGEPYTDTNNNGQYDLGEPYSDMNCNGVRDGPGAASTGVGASGNIVVYTVTYNWNILTPFMGPLLGKKDVNTGKYYIPMSSSIVVKNEPNLSGSSFCS